MAHLVSSTKRGLIDLEETCDTFPLLTSFYYCRSFGIIFKKLIYRMGGVNNDTNLEMTLKRINLSSPFQINDVKRVAVYFVKKIF